MRERYLWCPSLPGDQRQISDHEQCHPGSSPDAYVSHLLQYQSSGHAPHCRCDCYNAEEISAIEQCWSSSNRPLLDISIDIAQHHETLLELAQFCKMSPAILQGDVCRRSVLTVGNVEHVRGLCSYSECISCMSKGCC